MEIPDRIRWALTTIRLRPGDRVLEIGCGSGVAAHLVCERLTRGHLTAIDRSATALAQARRRNADHVAAGRLTLVRVDLTVVDPTALVGAPFDVVFAINVNVFWTKPNGPERGQVEALLTRRGHAWLFREEPAGRRTVLECVRRSRTRAAWS